VLNQGRSYPSRAWLLAPIIAVLIAVSIGVAFYYHGLPQTTTYPYFGWWFPFPWFFFFIPVFFIVFLGLRWVFWGGWWWGGGWYNRQYYDPAIEILKERFAKGELTKEQFEQMTRDLEQH
jgi:putative membrane protein